jgi:hypothetical protein
MRKRSGSYTTYSIGCALAWLLALTIARARVAEAQRRGVWLTCAGWWLGWLSATIARRVYPPPSTTTADD